MQILTAREMKAADERTSSEFGVPIATLMHDAGAAVARFVQVHFADARKVVVLCGKGNNGGDGLVAARILREAGRDVQVILVGNRGELKGAAAAALADFGGDLVTEWGSDPNDARRGALLDGAEVLVDAITGTGFRPPLRGAAAALRDKVAGLKVPVVAVDLPSGWDADAMEARGDGAFRANAVVTFTAPKPAHVFGMLTDGPIVVAQIGSPAGAVVSETGLLWSGTAKRLVEQPRDKDANKGKFGNVLVIAGSWGKAGAAGMAAMASLRAGAGLVTAAVPASILDTVAGFMAEVMTIPLDETANRTISMENLGEKLDKLLEKRSVVAIGPGLSTDAEAAEFARRVVESAAVPVVIDADALAAFENRAELLRGRKAFTVMTPHPGEMARLIGKTVKEVQADRLNIARDYARRHGVTLVLKGWRTLVAHRDGRVAVNTTGNPGMAKGGSGDILTGIVAAMLGQFPEEPERAVEAGVFLHGLAADFALLEQDEHTLCATDSVAHLWRAFRARVEDEDGFTWLQGLAP